MLPPLNCKPGFEERVVRKAGCVTIYTDASLDPVTKTGGWACWIKMAPGETALHSGAFREKVTGSTGAELMAIANAIVVAKRLVADRRVIFVVVTDSEQALQAIEQARTRDSHLAGFKQRKLNERHFLVAKAILTLVTAGCELRVNKVKAHCKSDGARSYVNQQVDKASRAAMRKARSA